jgi:hypothetical protein
MIPSKTFSMAIFFSFKRRIPTIRYLSVSTGALSVKYRKIYYQQQDAEHKPQTYKTSQLPLPISLSRRGSKKTSYLIQPPAQSVDACNPLFTYSVEDPTREEMSHILDLWDWGWEVSLHPPNDPEYLEAIVETERAIKKRRWLTQFFDGDCLGGAPRMTLEQIWIGEAERRLRATLFVVEEEERGMGRLEEWREKHLETVPEEPYGWQMAEVQLSFPVNGYTLRRCGLTPSLSCEASGFVTRNHLVISN